MRSLWNGTGAQGLQVELYLNYSSLQPSGLTFVFPLCTSVSPTYHGAFIQERPAKNILESMASCELKPWTPSTPQNPLLILYYILMCHILQVWSFPVPSPAFSWSSCSKRSFVNGRRVNRDQDCTLETIHPLQINLSPYSLWWAYK